MLCPVCKVPLTMTERQGIEIDYCPQCRGVWLDRGELDKIIERSQGQAPGPRPAAPPQPPQPSGYRPQPEYRPDPRRHDRDWDDDDDYRKKRRKNWLEELFD